MIFLSQGGRTSENVKAHKTDKARKNENGSEKPGKVSWSDQYQHVWYHMKLLRTWSQLLCRPSRSLHHPGQRHRSPRTASSTDRHHHTGTPLLCTFGSSVLLGKCLLICDGLVQITSPSTLLELQVIFRPANDNFIQTLSHNVSHLQWVCTYVSTPECKIFRSRDGTLHILCPAKKVLDFVEIRKRRAINSLYAPN